MKQKVFTLLTLLMTVMGASAEDYFVSLTAGSLPTGASVTEVSYTLNGNTTVPQNGLNAGEVAGPIPAGATVTITVSPATGYILGTVTGETFMDDIEMRTRPRRVTPVDGITVLGDVTVTPDATDPNKFSYTQPTANVKLTLGYKKVIQQSWITLTGATGLTYSGTAKTPGFTVTDGETDVTSHFTAAYTNNVAVAAADAEQAPTVTVTVKDGDATYAGSASVTFAIGQAPVTVTGGITAANKDYDGTTAATIDCSGAQLSGVVNGESVTISGVTGAFTDATAGANKTVNLSYTNAILTIGNDAAANYTLALSGHQATATATINAIAIGGVSVTGFDGPYDGQPHGIKVNGVPEGATVTYAKSQNDPYGETAPTFTVVCDATPVYYKVTQANHDDFSGSATVKITPATVTVENGITASNKDYDGTTAATIDCSGAQLSGVVNGETVTISGVTGTFADANAGTNKTVNLSYTGVALGGTDAGNYTLALSGHQATATATINPKAVTITTGSASKPFDDTPLTCATISITGLVSGETVTVTATGTQTAEGSSSNTYTIEWGETNANNYTVTSNLGTLEVLPSAIITNSEEVTQNADGTKTKTTTKTSDTTNINEDGSVTTTKAKEVTETTTDTADNVVSTTERKEVTETTTNADGSVTEKSEVTETTTDADGKKTEKSEVTERTMYADGGITETVTEKTTTADGSVTETVIEKTTKADGSVTETVIETTTKADGSSIVEKTTRNADGSSIVEKTTRNADGTKTEEITTIGADNSKTVEIVTKNAQGDVTSSTISETKASNGTTTTSNEQMSVAADGTTTTRTETIAVAADGSSTTQRSEEVQYADGSVDALSTSESTDASGQETQYSEKETKTDATGDVTLERDYLRGTQEDGSPAESANARVTDADGGTSQYGYHSEVKADGSISKSASSVKADITGAVTGKEDVSLAVGNGKVEASRTVTASDGTVSATTVRGAVDGSDNVTNATGIQESPLELGDEAVHVDDAATGEEFFEPAGESKDVLAQISNALLAFSADAESGISVGVERELTDEEAAGLMESEPFDSGNPDGWTRSVGNTRRLEAVRVSLNGGEAPDCNVWYRVHSQTYGWLGWENSGPESGSCVTIEGTALVRARCVDVQPVAKADKARRVTAVADDGMIDLVSGEMYEILHDGGIILTFMPSESPSIIKSIRIIKPTTVNNPTIELSENTVVYNGEEQKPTVVVKDGDTVIDPSEYTVTYENNKNVGTATVVITDNPGGLYVVNGSTTFTIKQKVFEVTAKNEWLTFAADMDVVLPEALVPYTCVIDASGTCVLCNEIASSKLIVGGKRVLKANNGVLLHGTPGTTYSFESVGEKQPAGNAKSYGNTVLEPVVEATHFNSGEIYVLTNNRFASILDTNTKVPANRAVIRLTDGVKAARVLEISNGVVDEIREVGEGEKAGEGWYTLDGRKLDGVPTKKGLYIHNGRKLVVR